ncbi:sigma-54-dependent transcriptional regulator [Terriglobus aquaticus]|uniref:Sigma-54-dependent transcriptional regulator n=1 Tax=Terriglobus aquaticus TaxID=940139 RepID=A0ABW9KKT6_9BACT
MLVIEDEPNMRRLIGLHLRQDGHTIHSVESLREAQQTLEQQDFDVILTDQKLPDGEGSRLLEMPGSAGSTGTVVLLTAFGTVELAVEAMRKGAFDFLTKPFAADNLRAVIARAAQHAQLRRENLLLRNTVEALEGDGEIYGTGTRIAALRELIRRVGRTDATVLITGETGTGKELVARAIHKLSARATKPLVTVNCAALPDTLLESELFGHEKGAFTGADRLRHGLFETAHQGTLFLDEVGEMSPNAQAKLLRALAEGKITRLGSSVSRDVDVRVLLATHRNLLREVEAGRFRQDLYYRLAVVPVEVPPLRERAEDIPVLAKHLLQQIASDLKMPVRTLHAKALKELQEYRYPGNVRELRNVLERACILSADPVIFSVNLPTASAATPNPAVPEEMDLRKALADWEKSAIVQMLGRTHGRKAEAARRLGLSKSDMTYKLAKYEISLPEEES